MTLKKTPKASYSFELNPAVVVEPYQNIRGKKDGVEVSLSVPVTPMDKNAKVGAAKPAGDGDLETFVANLKKGDTFKIDGEEMKVSKISKKKIKLENEESEIDLTPEELFNQSE